MAKDKRSPLHQLVCQILGGEERTDVLQTEEDVKALKRDLERTTEKAFDRFDKAAAKSAVAATTKVVRGESDALPPGFGYVDGAIVYPDPKTTWEWNPFRWLRNLAIEARREDENL